MEILTSKALWENYDPTAEPLDVNVFKIIERDGIVTKHLFFTGRSVNDTQKTRVYGIVCYKNTTATKQAVLCVGDYKKPINCDELVQFALKGFIAMAIDFAGRTDDGMYTAYPDCLNYCNALDAPDLFEVSNSAKQTKLYEYALNCRRAITYLATEEEKAKGVSLVTTGRGAYTGVIVMGVDNRLTNGAVLFGSLNCEYPEDELADEMDTSDTEELNRHLDYDSYRQAWTLGLAPQTYAMQIKIPVYVVNSANSNFVDIEQVNTANARMNRDCRFLTLPNAVDYVTDKYFDSVVRWLKGAQVPSPQVLTSAVDANGEYCLKVQTSSSINKTSVWYCSNAVGRAKYWRSAKLSRDGDCYLAKLDLFDHENDIIAFCLADREVAIATPLFYDKVKVSRPKIVNKNIFSGRNGTQYLIRLDPVGRVTNVELEQQLAEGYLGIIGAKGRALATFAICDSNLGKNASLTLGLDICCNVKQTLTVEAVRDFGLETAQRFRQTMQLDGAGKWQRITIERENFRRVEDGKQIADDDALDMIVMSADEEFIVNNVFLV